MSTDPGILERLERLERANRRLRAVAQTGGLALLVLVGLVLAGFSRRVRVPTVLRADSLRLRELTVVDGNGTVRVRIAARFPDAVMNGRRTPRGDNAAGVMLYDRTGQERGGYVTFDRSGVIGLTLDSRERQVAYIVAEPDGAAAARLEHDPDWVELRAASDGTRLSVGHGGRVVVQQPPMTEQEATAACSGLKEEVAQVKPAPPDSLVMAACQRHLTGEVCRQCLGKH